MSNRSGGYTSHVNQNHGQPEIQVIKLHKSTNGMGLSIVAAKVCNFDSACVCCICMLFAYIFIIIIYDFFLILLCRAPDRTD